MAMQRVPMCVCAMCVHTLSVGIAYRGDRILQGGRVYSLLDDESAALRTVEGELSSLVWGDCARTVAVEGLD
jgi:hypothetical protein